jgi:hypothetical protein
MKIQAQLTRQKCQRYQVIGEETINNLVMVCVKFLPSQPKYLYIGEEAADPVMRYQGRY